MKEKKRKSGNGSQIRTYDEFVFYGEFKTS